MVGNALEQASAARLNGDDQTAIAICQQILSAEPDNADAQSLLGVSLAETGNVGEARTLIESALQKAPNNWRFLLNRSVLEECEGNVEAARATADAAAKLAPDVFEVWGRVGDLAGKQGDFEGAAAALTKALDIYPEHPALLIRLAGACFETGAFDRAKNALQTFEKIVPGHPDALRLRAQIAHQSGDWEGHIEAAKAWLAKAPHDLDARTALAFAYAEPGFYARATETYKPLVDAAPSNVEHLSTMGRYLLSARDLDGAETYYRRALEIEPDHSETLSGLARLMTFLGRFDDAAELSRRAIKAEPKNVEAYAQLVMATGGRITEDEIDNLKNLGRDENQLMEHRAVCWFAAGDGHHRRKQADAAFEAWAEACRIKFDIGQAEADTRYEPDAHERYVGRIMKDFDSDPSLAPVSSGGQPTPIFIVGMPRSGTTLLESALGAHKDVACAGELPVTPFVRKEFEEWADASGWHGGAIPQDMINAIRQKYFEQYRELGIRTAPFVTDKQPNNFLAVGLIRHAFPEARIIHIRRNPMETGFSIFRRNFARAWQFPNSLEFIGHYYGQHSRICAHWSEILGENFAFIQYEDLVRNFESELRRLVDFCGLEWDPACLEYYKQDRSVITFSAVQVRKPPSVDHLNSTAPYLKFLTPLRKALEESGVDIETGALISNAKA